MNGEEAYQGSCFCGAVELVVSGEPAGIGYCHCESCRRWSAGPVNAFTLWKREAVRITRGADNTGTYSKSTHSYRRWCKTCGGHIFTEHPGMELIDVHAAAILDFPYHTGIHVHVQKPKVRIKDRLSRLKGATMELGDSGVRFAE